METKSEAVIELTVDSELRWLVSLQGEVKRQTKGTAVERPGEDPVYKPRRP